MSDGASPIRIGSPPLGGADEDDELFEEQKRTTGKGLRGGKKDPGTPSEAPLHQRSEVSPQVPSWHVYEDAAGTRIYLGPISTFAGPDDLVRVFTASMPLAGASKTFLLVGVNQLGQETKEVRAFTIGGDSPVVLAARAKLTPQQQAQGSIKEALDAVLKLREAGEAELKRQSDALILERRKVADAAVEEARQRTTEAEKRAERELERERQRHEQALEAARERYAQERQAEADRRKEEREAREKAEERRERHEREQHTERLRIEAEERQRQREHQATMLQMLNGNGIEKTIEKLLPVFTMLGGPAIVAKLWEKFDGDGGSSTEAIALAVSNGLGKISDNVSDVIKTQMEIDAAREGVPIKRVLRPREEPKPEQKPAETRSTLPQPRIEARKKEEPAKAPAGTGKGAASAPPAAPSTSSATPDAGDLPLNIQRAARIALRKVADQLQAETDPTKWELILQKAALKTPAIVPYIQKVGVKNAALEAGCTPQMAEALDAEANKRRKG